MDELTAKLDQQGSRRLYQALVRQAMICVQYAVEYRNEAAPVQHFLDEAGRWLDAPDSESPPAWEKRLITMKLITEEFTERRRHASLITMSNWFELILVYLCDVMQSSHDLTQAAKDASQLAFIVPMVRHKKGMGKLYSECRRLSQATVQWQQDAASAILKGQEPPSFSIPADPHP